jgi:hypothetical protein
MENPIATLPFFSEINDSEEAKKTIDFLHNPKKGLKIANHNL